LRTSSPPGPEGRPSSGALDRRFTHTHDAILRRGCAGGVQGGGGRPHSRTLRVLRSVDTSGLWCSIRTGEVGGPSSDPSRSIPVIRVSNHLQAWALHSCGRVR
jgi:hypothetical protein